jgi:ribonuclease HII
MEFVAGIDEAGRGALAGPVVVAAVVLRPWERMDGVQDSKQLTPRRRELLYRDVTRQAVAVGVGVASPREVDMLNVWHATCLAARRALQKLPVPVQHILMDGCLSILGVVVPQTPIVDGDARCLSIASASIVAKVRRDRMMELLGSRYPSFEFHRHKGYGTPRHTARLRLDGPVDQHRMTFAPLAQPELW